jgi:hypothetical protein
VTIEEVPGESFGGLRDPDSRPTNHGFERVRRACFLKRDGSPGARDAVTSIVGPGNPEASREISRAPQDRGAFAARCIVARGIKEFGGAQKDGAGGAFRPGNDI